ncbi:hypothetical protein [Anaerosporobacter faecicola]|uniref:hypothetical protein n=1 Tax=Anaerosporobacter faecicola TaxID=2718714 RepID=UPI00143883EB|nr:hypothetical protein [Anaerosporobacter faecicola]
MKAELVFRNQEYNVLMMENEADIAIEELDHNVFGLDQIHLNYHCQFEVKEYHLYLRMCEILCMNGYRAVLKSDSQKENELPLGNMYTGSVVIGRNVVMNDDTTIVEPLPCYHYEEVMELIFSQGVLVTTVNHNRAMKRVRMNLECGYRSLNKKKDVRCIQKFLKDSFVGRYKELVKK